MDNKRKIPELEGHWLLGNLPEFKKAPHSFLANAARPGQNLIRFRLLNKSMVGIVGPECAEYIFKTNSPNYPRGKQRKPLESLLGLGLVNLEEDEWKQHRRLIALGFKPDFMKFTFEQNVKLVTKLLHNWENQAQKGNAVEAGAEMRHFTLAVIIKALFSADLDWEKYEVNYRAIIDANTLLFKRYTSLIKAPDWLPTSLNRELSKARDAMDKLSMTYLNRKINDPDRQTHDIGDHLLTLMDKGEMTLQEVLDEIRTLLVAGFETTATALTWTLYLIAGNPNVTGAWEKELEEQLGSQPPTWDVVGKLKQTEHLLMEGLRLFPPVYMISRTCRNDDVVHGYQIAAGTPVLLSIFSIHRSPEIWKNPDSYIPERFNHDWPEHAYLPFGIGKHICIGSRFSMLESILILASIGQRFRISLTNTEEVKPDAKVTLIPNREIWLTLEKRKIETVE